MRIYIVCGKLNHGGAERVAVALANGFVERGHQVTIVSNLYEEVTYGIDKRVQLKNLVASNHQKLKKWFSAIGILRGYLKEDKPDVIIGIMQLFSVIAKIASRGMNIPLVMTEHDSFERPNSAPFSKRDYFCKYFLNRIYKHVTVLTQADKDVIGHRLKHVAVMPNPLFLTPVETVSEKEKVVLASGRLYDWHYKGLDVLLQAWSKIISNEQLEISNYDYSQDGKPSHWWLKIAGIGTEESLQYLMNLLPDGEWVALEAQDSSSNSFESDERRKTKDENIKNNYVWKSEKYRIEFLGFRKDIEELYKKSSVFVLSSRYEGFGLVLIEAMSQGCAPVACDYKGRQTEILSPSGDERRKTKNEKSGIEITENGILCEPDDVEALASALKKMMEDEVYRKKVQLNAVERSKFYSMENTMNRWEEYLKNIVS